MPLKSGVRIPWASLHRDRVPTRMVYPRDFSVTHLRFGSADAAFALLLTKISVITPTRSILVLSAKDMRQVYV